MAGDSRPDVGALATEPKSRVSVDGVELAYDRVGDGPPIVLAHGFGGTSRRWSRLATELVPDFELVAYDARGHGESDVTETGYAVEDRVGDLCGLVRELNLDAPVLLGHSMGAVTVAWAAAWHPDLPGAVALEDPPGLHEQPEREPEERAAEARANAESADDASAEPHVAAEVARAGYPAPLAEAFPDLACPVLLLRSDRSVEERVADLDAADALPNGRLVHVPDAGHNVFDDEFDAACAELRTFLERIRAVRRR